MLRSCIVAMVFWGTLCVNATAQDSPFELEDGDSVIFLGNSFFERALGYGHIETALSVPWPDRKISFRNLGWDGDTVFGHSRAGGRRRAIFGDAEEGFQRMVKHVRSLNPTVVFLAYGFNESFNGTAGRESFRTGIQRLIAELDSSSTRFVLISPHPIQGAFALKPSKLQKELEGALAQRNGSIKEYRDVVSDVASQGGHGFVDLFALPSKPNATDNGIHFNDHGYRTIAGCIADQLRLPPSRVRSATASDRVREAIVEKNRLYFHRWRPRNDAFVYGERKDEQKIAQTEPEKFEPFIAKQEATIRELLAQHGVTN